MTNQWREQREAIVKQHVDAENAHDLEGVIKTFHATARYDVPAMGPAGQADDSEAVHALMSSVFAGFPDWHVETGPLYHGDTTVFTEFRMTGTHQGVFAGIPPTGRRMDVRIGALFEFEEDRL